VGPTLNASIARAASPFQVLNSERVDSTELTPDRDLGRFRLGIDCGWWLAHHGDERLLRIRLSDVAVRALLMYEVRK